MIWDGKRLLCLAIAGTSVASILGASSAAPIEKSPPRRGGVAPPVAEALD